MNLKKEDVEKIYEVGTLYGDSVKLLKTWGGLHVLVGKKDKDSKSPDTLAAASHRALAIYQIEKQFGDDFKPAIMKSEGHAIEQVKEYPTNLNKYNLDVFSLTTNDKVDFVIAKNGFALAVYECSLVKGAPQLQKYTQKLQHEVLTKNADEIRKEVANIIINFKA